MAENGGRGRGSSRPAPVFISYASQDAAAAQLLCAALETAAVSCWVAPRDVVPGEFYADAIVRAVDAARIVVLVLSQNAAASPHVIREIERAASKRLPIVSLRIDAAPMQPALEYFLNTSHWLDASASGIAPSLPRLVNAVETLLATSAASVELPAPRRQKLTDSAIAMAPTHAGPKSIAVLPFANMSSEQDQQYFSDGLAEEIINLLAQIRGLKVIARTSAFAFRGKEQDVRGIAAALGVTHVLEGSVRRAGNRLRVTGQLIDAADGTHLWSERYDRELIDVFAVQDEISAAIVGALRVSFSAEVSPRRRLPNLAAYEAYLKARHLAAKVTPDSLELARHCYEQAIELDAAFALAHIGLGNYWVCVMIFGRCSAHEAVPAARAEAHRALRIDPSLPEAHALLGLLAAMYDFDWTAAAHHFEFPLAKQASFATFRPMYGWFQFLSGNVEQAIALARHVIEEDPLDVWPRMNLHAYLQSVGGESEALEQLKKVLELDEHQVVALVSMAMLYQGMGDHAQALAIARRAYAVAPWYRDAIAVLAAFLRRTGAEAEARSLVQALGAGHAIGDAPAHALLHLLSGDVHQGAVWAEKAIEERDLSMMIYLRFVVCKELRASNHWPKIAKMLNLPGNAVASLEI